MLSSRQLFLSNSYLTMKLISLLLFVPFVWSQTAENATTIAVVGTGSSVIVQSETSVRLTVQNSAQSAQVAQQKTASAVSSVISVLNSYNVTDLETKAITLQPLYNYTDSPPRLIAFESSESLSYTVSPELAGETLDAAVRAGANVIDSVESTSEKNATNAAYLGALDMATKDAENKARVVADSLNACIVAPLVVDVPPNDFDLPTPTMFAGAMEAATMSDMKSAPTVLPGNTEVSATVSIIYSQTPGVGAEGSQERRKRR